GYVALYSGLADWPFMLASMLCVIAGIEEILITFILPKERTDVRSLRAAWHIKKRLSEQNIL
ncbi:MAG: CDP-alcohol phosphatidyltransferase, partial [Deltaproteobacteria bacterium]|nr:CDP-alcohol phosphatidyltransferase [Deltaproteobacteria bacterium]